MALPTLCTMSTPATMGRKHLTLPLTPVLAKRTVSLDQQEQLIQALPGLPTLESTQRTAVRPLMLAAQPRFRKTPAFAKAMERMQNKGQQQQPPRVITCTMPSTAATTVKKQSPTMLPTSFSPVGVKAHKSDSDSLKTMMMYSPTSSGSATVYPKPTKSSTLDDFPRTSSPGRLSAAITHNDTHHRRVRSGGMRLC